MKRRVASVISIIMFSLFLQGCFNYREINKTTFATSIIFDIDEYDNVILYLDCIRPYRDAGESSDKGRRMIFNGKGKTALEALRDIDVISSNKLDFTQVRAYIFTEQAARKGIKNYLDLINNDQQLSFKPYMFLYYGNVKDILKQVTGDEEYLGLYLDQLVEKNKKSAKVIASNVNDYITDTLTGNKFSFMTGIEIKKDAVDEKIEINGGALMKDNYLLETLDETDILMYNLLNGNVNEGTFQVPNPEEKDKFITLDILEHYVKDNVEKNNDTYNITKNVRIRVSIGEIQGKLKVDNSILKDIQQSQEEKLESYLEDYFNKYKKKNIDILDLNTVIIKKYKNELGNDILSKIKLKVNVELTIDGSGITKESI